MRKAVKRFICVAFLACMGLVMVQAQTPSGIQGVWQVIEVTDQLGSNTKPQPGVYIFTNGHPSIVEVQGTAERPDLAMAA